MLTAHLRSKNAPGKSARIYGSRAFLTGHNKNKNETVAEGHLDLRKPDRDNVRPHFKESSYSILHLSRYTKMPSLLFLQAAVCVVQFAAAGISHSVSDRLTVSPRLTRNAPSPDLPDCPVERRRDCRHEESSPVCGSHDVCKGVGVHQHMKCCFDGCQSACTMPPAIDWYNQPLKDDEEGYFVTGQSAAELGELCRLATEDPTLRCPHGYVCKAFVSKATAATDVPEWGECVEGDVCALPVEEGRCGGSEERYYFDQGRRKCRPFNYTGCQGNDNNFRSVRKCETACADVGGRFGDMEEDAELFEEPTTAEFLLPYKDPCLYHVCSNPGEKCQLVYPAGNIDDPEATCTCSYDCPLRYEPVCASDEKKYDNECLMRQEMCKTKKTLYILYPGECSDPCRTHQCPTGKQCRINAKTGKPYCECFSSCEDSSSPACGLDGKWYPSLCWLHVAACRKNRKIVVERVKEEEVCGKVKIGMCPKVTHKSQDSCKKKHNECTRDFDCNGNYKCCFDGCSHHCQNPLTEERDCQFNGKWYQHLESFSEGCMECSCHFSRVKCSLQSCVPGDDEDDTDSESGSGSRK
eukprot:m.310160 g.310160  ORF g.310160 m.310160 type:complete len:579 (+) comp49949_c0_seq1:252-1988(+)